VPRGWRKKTSGQISYTLLVYNDLLLQKPDRVAELQLWPDKTIVILKERPGSKQVYVRTIPRSPYLGASSWSVRTLTEGTITL